MIAVQLDLPLQTAVQVRVPSKAGVVARADEPPEKMDTYYIFTSGRLNFAEPLFLRLISECAPLCACEGSSILAG